MHTYQLLQVLRDIRHLPSAAGTSLPVTFLHCAAGQGCKRQQGCLAALNHSVSFRTLRIGTSFVIFNSVKDKCKLSCFLKPTAYFVLFTQAYVLHRQLPSSASASLDANTRTLFHMNAELYLV